MNFGIQKKSLSILRKTLSDFPEVQKVIVFGSRAMGNEKTGSDIDLALIGTNITPETISKISRILNQEQPIPYTVEIIDYNKINNPELKKHIDAEGKVFYLKGNGI